MSTPPAVVDIPESAPRPMDLPEDCFLAYVVNHEAWYYEANRQIDTLDGRSLNVSASAHEGGCAWEFVVQERDIAGGTIRLQMFADSFEAFEQIPEFFAALTAEQPHSLDHVREILDRLGATDTTARNSPHRRDLRAELVSKVEEAQTELARYDAEHSTST